MEELSDLSVETFQTLKNAIVSNDNLNKVMREPEKKVVKYRLLL